MKTLILVLSLAISSVAFGKSCEEQALKSYMNTFVNNEFHHLTGEVYSFKKLEKSFKYYGTEVELGFDVDVEVFFAASEYMGGYGIEAVVVDSLTCETLKMVNVYAE